MFGLTAVQLLSLSVLAAAVTTVGNLLATLLKDYVIARRLQEWNERQAILSLYRRYRYPILQAAKKFKARVDDVCDQYPPAYLRSELIGMHPRRLGENLADDPHYQRYRLISTLYRMCAFLGWSELYRREVDATLLEPKRQRANRRLEEVGFEPIESQFADGQLNEAPDRLLWKDGLIFREELRAIGEGMISESHDSHSVIGYLSFVALFERAATDDTIEGDLWWLRLARDFLLDMEKTRDFRRERFKRMRDSLAAVIKLLERDAP